MSHYSKLSPFLVLLAISLSAIAQNPKINLVQIASGLSRPIDIKHCGDERLFVIEQAGLIYIMDKSGNVNPSPFLDISSMVLSVGNEQGLLGLAFSPNYKSDGYFFVNFVGGTGNGFTEIARFSVDPADSSKALVNSKLTLLKFDQPGTTHNGGNMMFGKDGYLYISQGDGGGGNNSQNNNTYHAKILRIDPFNGTPYAIPPDNPLFGQANVKQEIWSTGLRNPWRCSFDQMTGDLWIADVGQDSMEEIDFQPHNFTGLANYGWRCYEATIPYLLNGCGPVSDYVFPVYSYRHSTQNGCSVTGGYVYRGTQYPNLYGKYIFTDACSGRIWAIRQPMPGVFETDILGNFLNFNFVTFGEDNKGELYIGGFKLMQAGTGRIWRLTDTSSCPTVHILNLPDSLCNTDPPLGLMADVPGGTFTVAGVASEVLDPSQLFIATYPVVYTYTDANGCTSADTQLVVIKSCVNGVSAPSKILEFSIYPNPNKGDFEIRLESFSGAGAVTVSLFDNAGKLLKQQSVSGSQKILFTGAPLAPGVYFVEIKNRNGKAVKAFSVQ
ncbi:MAG: PQQ-dependent sugar dehydrogenase [Saprospiraceae bacterium]